MQQGHSTGMGILCSMLCCLCRPASREGVHCASIAPRRRFVPPLQTPLSTHSGARDGRQAQPPPKNQQGLAMLHYASSCARCIALSCRSGIVEHEPPSAVHAAPDLAGKSTALSW